MVWQRNLQFHLKIFTKLLQGHFHGREWNKIIALENSLSWGTKTVASLEASIHFGRNNALVRSKVRFVESARIQRAFILLQRRETSSACPTEATVFILRAGHFDVERCEFGQVPRRRGKSFSRLLHPLRCKGLGYWKEICNEEKEDLRPLLLPFK